MIDEKNDELKVKQTKEINEQKQIVQKPSIINNNPTEIEVDRESLKKRIKWRNISKNIIQIFLQILNY